MRKLIVTLITVSALSLGACQQQGGGFNRQQVGTVLGGAAGAAVGSQIGGGKGQLISVAAGTLIGAMIGSDIGNQLDKVDQQYYSNASYRAFESTPTGKSVNWNNPDSGNYGSTTVTKTYADTQCREYVTNVYVHGQQKRAYGTACRQPDGTWRIQN